MNEEFTIKNDEVKKLIDGIDEAWENIDPVTQDELYMMDGYSVAEYLCKVVDLLDFLSDKCDLEDNNSSNEGDEGEDKDVDDYKESMDILMDAITTLPEGSISHHIPRNPGRYPCGKE